MSLLLVLSMFTPIVGAVGVDGDKEQFENQPLFIANETSGTENENTSIDQEGNLLEEQDKNQAPPAEVTEDVTSQIEISADTATNTVTKMVQKTSDYYKSSVTKIGWTSIVALWGAGENVEKGTWNYFDWSAVDPGLNPKETGTEHIRHIFSSLAMGQDPSNLWETKRNLFGELAAQQGENGAIGAVNKHMWAILALDTGEKLDLDVGQWNKEAKEKALRYLLSQQKTDGGFAFGGSTMDPDMTGMALLALSNYQDESAVATAIERAKAVLKEKQLDQGGWASYGSENSNSIATVISGLVAIGEDPLSGEWTKNGQTPLDALQRFQLENGSFTYLGKNPAPNLMATEQSLIALTDIQTGKSVWQRIAKIEISDQDQTGESDITVQVHVIGKNSEIHSNNKVKAIEKQTALDALKQALDTATIDYELEISQWGMYVKSINGESAGSLGGWDGWMYSVNDEILEIGADAYELREGDNLKFYYSRWASIASDSKIEGGAVNPTATVRLVGDTFGADVTNKANWAFKGNDTGLEIVSIKKETDQEVTITFKGTAKTGVISVVALVKALDGNQDSDEISIQVTKEAVVPATEETLREMISNTVQFYKTRDTELSSWWGIMALWGAGENLTDGTWKLPSWKSIDPKLNENTYDTEHIRYIFGLLAMGEDPSDAWETNRNLYAELAKQQAANGAIGGINKHVWAMLALDAGEKQGHDVGLWKEEKKQQALKYVLDSQKIDGGFALFGNESDTDVTGMVLLALANYQGDSAVDAAIERAKKVLKERQLDTAGFNSSGTWGTGDNSNSLSTSVSGLTAIGENLLSKEWIVGEKTVVDSYKRFEHVDGSFKFKLTDKAGNMMATEQALIALLDIQTGKSVWQRIAEPKQSEPDTGVIQITSSDSFVLDKKWKENTSEPVVLDFGKLDAQELPEITAERGHTVLEIPKSTGVLTNTWDKKIQMPTVQITSDDDKAKIESKLKDKKVSNVGVHIKVGGDERIEFNQYVTMTLKNQGENEAGFIDSDGVFELIKKYSAAEVENATDEVYSYKVGNDLVIKTKHFTQFLTFQAEDSKTENPGTGGGGVPPSEIAVTLSVEKRSMGQGDIITSMKETLQSGDTAFTLLKRVADQKGVSIKSIGSGAELYVQAIDGLAEFDGGPLSGWMYSVNGVFPNHSAGTYFLKDGDTLRWQYTKNLGEDIGDSYVPGGGQGSDGNQDTGQVITKKSISDAANWINKNRNFSNYDHFIDWDVLGLARSNQEVPSTYYKAFENYVKEEKGNFRKVTDYERMALAVTAIGKDPRNVAGYNFIEKIYNNERMTTQGTNGVIFALLAMDANNYEVPNNALWTREKLLTWLLEQQKSDGGFPLAEGAASDIDMTAMALQALANPNYQKIKEAKTATDKAVTWLSEQQQTNGGFQSAGSENSESISQVIIALSSLGIDSNDKRFKKEKGDLLTALLSFINTDGGISHTKGGKSDYMATQQGLMAFSAYNRFENRINSLYDMTDAIDKKPAISFSDVTKHSFGQEEIYKLVEAGVINGYPDGTFKPNQKLIRGQAAILFTRALKLDIPKSPVGFKDVSKSSSYFEAAHATKAAGIFKGNGTTFGAADELTREQMASVLVRAFDLKGTNAEVKLTDLGRVSNAHRKDVEILYQNGITLGNGNGQFDPKGSVSRAHFAVFLSRAMNTVAK